METQTKHNHDVEKLIRKAVQDLRRALIELYADVGVDPTRPQEVSRKLGIHRNLSWKLSRVMNAADPFDSLNHLPGQQGLQLALAAFEKGGATTDSTGDVRKAMERFEETVVEHAGDRTQLELSLESMGLFEPEHQLESGREQAFRGNSMIWGVQAKARVTTLFAAPSAIRKNAVDFVLVSGICGFRRLRPSAQWRLFRSQISDDKGHTLNESELKLEEIFPDASSVTPHVLRDYCTPTMPEIVIREGPEGREYLLPPGPIGPGAAFDCISGYVLRGLPSVKDENNEYASAACPISLPVETVQLDVVLHRDIENSDSIEYQVFGYPNGGVDSPPTQTTANLLPIRLKPTELAGPPPALATPLFPAYGRLASRVYERMGWNPEEFSAQRLQVAFPPMSTRLVARWRLPEAK